MGLNRPITKTFFLRNGAVKTSGGSKNLADGQFAIVDNRNGTQGGAVIVSAFAGLPKNEKRYAIQVGRIDLGHDRSFDNKQNSTTTFALKDLKNVRVSAPKRTEIQVDEYIVGYDGFNPATSLSFKKGQTYWNLSLEVKNGLMQYTSGGLGCEIVNVSVNIPECDPMNTCDDCDECEAVDCSYVITEALRQLREKELTGGVKLTEMVEIKPVIGGCDNNPTPNTVDFVTWTLSVCDTGDAEALAAVAAQYDVPVIRINRVGSISTYQMMVEGTDDPADYVQTVPSLLKGCATCPDGYTEVPGGLLYAITIEDDGVDRTSVIEAALASSKVVSGTARKNGNDNGVGLYTIVYSEAITPAEIASFVGTSTNGRNTAIVQLVGSAASFCSDSTETEIAWVEGETCTATTEQYTINLRDTECGESRLAELQTAYPNLTIAIDVDPSKRSRALTLTGSSGTANINVGGTDYLATYATSLTVTAANFVTAHAATILAAHNVVVTANAGVLTFAGLTATVGAITIANATTNLSGTLATAVQDVPFRVNCSTQYIATAKTNIVCEECSPVFRDFYFSSTPRPYNQIEWAKVDVAVNPNTGCYCGISFKGKYFVISGDEALRDVIPFTESATEIQVSAGYNEEIREGIGFIPKGVDKVTPVSRYAARTHLYGNSREIEASARAFQEGTFYQPEYQTRLILGETAAVQNNLAQYVSYYVTLEDKENAGGFGQVHSKEVEYEFRVELGKHAALEAKLNELAAAAGLPGVQA